MTEILERHLSTVCPRAVVQEVVHHLVQASQVGADGPHGFGGSDAKKTGGQGEDTPEKLPRLPGDDAAVFCFGQNPALSPLLGDLPSHRALHSPDEDLQKPGRFRGGSRPVGRRQEVVTQDQGGPDTSRCRQGGLSSAFRSLVQDIVVKERGLVHHFHRQGSPPEPVIQIRTELLGNGEVGYQGPEYLPVQGRPWQACLGQAPRQPGEVPTHPFRGFLDGLPLSPTPASLRGGARTPGGQSDVDRSGPNHVPTVLRAREGSKPGEVRVRRTRCIPQASTRARSVARTAPQRPAAAIIPRGMRRTTPK